MGDARRPSFQNTNASSSSALHFSKKFFDHRGSIWYKDTGIPEIEGMFCPQEGYQVSPWVCSHWRSQTLDDLYSSTTEVKTCKIPNTLKTTKFSHHQDHDRRDQNERSKLERHEKDQVMRLQCNNTEQEWSRESSSQICWSNSWCRSLASSQDDWRRYWSVIVSQEISTPSGIIPCHHLFEEFNEHRQSSSPSCG